MVQNLSDGDGFVLWRGPKNGEVSLQFFFRPLRTGKIKREFSIVIPKCEPGTAKRLYY